jgi:hypothetical protein
MIQTFTVDEKEKCLDAVRVAFPVKVDVDACDFDFEDDDIETIFGPDAITDGGYFTFDDSARWTWFDMPDDAAYFKTEVDAILFKMRFL